jgi:Raf kinase inhibitor-like YbhB/YbcL family protein
MKKIALYMLGVACFSLGGSVMALQLTSSVFAQGDTIPTTYTADGADISPPLAWSKAPFGTKSFVLIMDDPDAPRGTWVHWVVYNLPATCSTLPEKVAKTLHLANGAQQGRSDFGDFGYGGPAPPRGNAHRYFFTLYALDDSLQLGEGAQKAEVVAAMQGHILAKTELIGKYGR